MKHRLVGCTLHWGSLCQLLNVFVFVSFLSADSDSDIGALGRDPHSFHTSGAGLGESSVGESQAVRIAGQGRRRYAVAQRVRLLQRRFAR